MLATTLVNQEMMDEIQKAKSSGLTLKLSRTTIAFTGSAGAGKTNFLNLLCKRKFVPYHYSTGLAMSENISIKRVGVLGSLQWIEMNYETMLRQLKSYLSSIEMMPTSSETLQNRSQDVKLDGQCLVESDITRFHTYHSSTPLLGEVWTMINLLDTGSQPEFISLFPAIKSSIALTFVILNMKGGAKSLDELVVVIHNQGWWQSYEPYCLSMTSLNFLWHPPKKSVLKLLPPCCLIKLKALKETILISVT